MPSRITTSLLSFFSPLPVLAYSCFRYMLGYLPKEDRVFLMDNARNVVSFRVLLSVLQFQTAVVRGDMDSANALVPALPESEHSHVARFLESQGLKDEALSLTKDPDQKFDLALELGRLDIATELLAEVRREGSGRRVKG